MTDRNIEVKGIRVPFTHLPQVLVSDECEHGRYWTRVWDWNEEYVSEITAALDEFKASVPAPSCETLHEEEESPPRSRWSTFWNRKSRGTG